ncbi:hypothetical protein HYH02_005119 [Chlamydomonas schloesseri]|uniref:Protein transport protein SEC23 n=1 Tax=Chlamydomonas schloesseri TaxID=2026947 RepID=A0A836B728_9CHLO|nr:hypothetical protein HYH02_005119 [Chlamydomonas schloesseri]|eukprot:KAG2449586.1 hypothetical protein HYH02_005119 [Chlamydomonas schloesseri]
MQSPGQPAAATSNGGAAVAAPGVAPCDHVLTLVAGCVVNQRAFANTCGVPLGAHIDFVPSSALRLPQITGRTPLRCNGCSGFMNVYCKTNLTKWVWKCNLCGAVNVHKEQLGHSADVASYPELCGEAVEYVLPLPSGAAGPAHTAQAVPPHVVFAVDTTLEPSDLRAVKEAVLAAASSLPPTTLISLITFDGSVALHNLGPDHRASYTLPAAFAAPPVPGAGGVAAAPAGGGVVPGAEHSADQQAVIQQLLDKYCSRTAGSGVGPGGSGMLVAPAGQLAAVLPKVLATLRTVQGDVPVRVRARCLCAAVEASLRLVAVAAHLDLGRHHYLAASRVVLMAAGPATRGPGAVPLDLLDQAVSEKGRSPDNKAVAAALDLGAALGAMAAKIGVAVDIFTSTNMGINAPLLTAIAHSSGGELMPQVTPPHHLPTHTSGHNPSHGGANHSNSSHSSHGHHHHSHGHPTAVSAAPMGATAGGFVPGLLSRQLRAALVRRWGVEGRLDCFCSEGLRLTQWMGPLDPIRADLEDVAGTPAAVSVPTAGGDAEQLPRPGTARDPGAGVGGAPWRLSSSACGITALEVGRGASLRLEVTRDLDVPSLLLQVALHYTDLAAQQRVVRVVTRKIQVVESRSEFLRTVNPTAAAALLGKRAVLDAKKAGAFRDARKAEEARLAVGAQLGLVAARCGREVLTSRGLLGFGGRKLWQWPPELMPLSYALYHFTRGPILGAPAPPPPGTHPASAHAHLHALWDSDTRLVGINTLLWSAWGDAYRAMAPKLYAVLPPPPPPQPATPFPDADAAAAAAPPPPLPQLAALPCVSLAAVMARTVPLVLDAGTSVLVSPTEEPAPGGSTGAGVATGAAAGLTLELIEAALQAAGAATEGGTAGASPSPGRFPMPSVVLTPGAQAGGGQLVLRLIPVHRDPYDEQALQQPQLQQLGQAVAAQLSKQLLESGKQAAAAAVAALAAAGLPQVQAKQSAAAAASFAEWCRGVNVQPFPVQ